MSATTQPVNTPTTQSTTASYVAREINISVTLGEGTFGQSGANTVTLSNLRISASIAKRGGPGFDQANVRIYGMAPALMNQISTLGVPQTMGRNNVLQIAAGDPVNGITTVFTGTLYNAYQVLDEAPDSAMVMDAWGGWDQAMIPVQPISYPGGADVGTIMEGLANQMGFAFENDGVQVQLASPYFAGTAMDQAQACARAANAEMTIDTGTVPNTLAIWPKTGTRGGLIPLISAASDLIGYPRFQQYGMSFRCIFNPSLKLGGQVRVQSTLFPPSTATAGSTKAELQAAGPNGIWYIQALNLDLSAQLPDGPWFCDCTCARVAGTPLPQ